MTDEFIRRGLTTSVAQICSNVGWHSMSNSNLQMLTDILYEYFKDMAQLVKKFAEISDAIEPDIEDIKKVFRVKNIVIPDLINYLKKVDCIEFPHKIPKFPIPAKSNLNIMKIGSKEIVTRPVYFHEHLPSLYPNEIRNNHEKASENSQNLNQILSHSSSMFETINDILCLEKSPDSTKNDGQSKHMIVHRRLRELSSVVMTTSGFLSPSREGKLPESRLSSNTNIKQGITQTSYSIILPKIIKEHNNYEHHKNVLSKTSGVNEKLGNIIENSNFHNNENSKIKKLRNIKEMSKLEILKKNTRESNRGLQLKKNSKFNKSKLNLLNIIFDKPIQSSKNLKNNFENSEKLKIFKKISKNNDMSGYQNTKSLVPKLTSTIVSSDTLPKLETKFEVIEKIPFKTESIQSQEKKCESKNKSTIKDTESNHNIKKRKKKEKNLNGDFNPTNQISIEPKKIKTKHNLDLCSPLKFSFFGNLPSGTNILPPLLAKNPLVPNYDNLNKVLPILEKSNTITSNLPLPGDDYKTYELYKPSTSVITEKQNISEKTKSKKQHKKKDKIKSKKKKKKKTYIKLDKKKEKFEEKKIIKEDSLVQKIKFKLPNSNDTNSSTCLEHKILIKPIIKNKSPIYIDDISQKKLPVDQVSSPKTLDKDTSFVSKKEITSLPENNKIKPKKTIVGVLSNNVIKNNTATKSSENNSTSKNIHKIKTSKKAKNIQEKCLAFYFDEIGNQIWICPSCSKKDDGSPMIACDLCDAWYHWICVGIQYPPTSVVWYCPTCELKITERGNKTLTKKAKRGRPLKKKTVS